MKRVEFLAPLLMKDVTASVKRLKELDTQSNRRDHIRCVGAALDGLIWSSRDDIGYVANRSAHLNQIELLALRDSTYRIRENGRIDEKSNYTPMVTSVKMVIRIGKKVFLTWKYDLSSDEYETLDRFVSVRNRITHPKSVKEMEINDTEIYDAGKAFDLTFGLAREATRRVVEWMAS